MPKTTRSGRPKKEELPSTLRRSPEKAQRTFAKVHDNAVEQYGEGERAHRTAFDALKHSYEKVGDRWVAKRKKGPSDAQAARSGPDARPRRQTAGGVDVLGHTREELLERAKRLGITGRHRMNKEDLGAAIAKRESSRSRRSARRSA
jgi:cation transport regulator ChaB